METAKAGKHGKTGKITVTSFVMIWCSIIWIGFSAALVGIVYLVTDNVEQNLIREEMNEAVRSYARHLSLDSEENFHLDDFDELEKGYYCVILDAENQYVFGDCPREFLTYRFDSRGSRKVTLGGIRYLLEYHLHDLRRYAKINGKYKICGIARADASTPLLKGVRMGVCGFILVSLLLLLGLNLLLRRRIATPLREMGEKAKGMGSRMDFSENMNYESGFQEIDTLAAAYQDVFRKMEAVIDSQNQFNSDVSHELHTPLTVIQAKSQVAREYAERTQNEDYLETLEVIDRQTNKMNQMIDDLMSLSRLKRGEEVLARETFDLAQVVESVCEEEMYVPGWNRQLDCELSEAMITADVNLVVIAVGNLLSNAVKYSEEGSVIRIRCGMKDGKAFCSVSDEGIGISEEIQDRIFDSFYRAEESRTSEGFGLGLTLTKKIMELHGGQVTVESFSGKGSTFTLLFPGA